MNTKGKYKSAQTKLDHRNELRQPLDYSFKTLSTFDGELRSPHQTLHASVGVVTVRLAEREEKRQGFIKYICKIPIVIPLLGINVKKHHCIELGRGG